jgi:hypothetical protein
MQLMTEKIYIYIYCSKVDGISLISVFCYTHAAVLFDFRATYIRQIKKKNTSIIVSHSFP